MVHKTLNLSPDVYSAFSYFRKLVKAAIMSDRLRWLKSVDDNFKTQPIEFWKYVSNLKRKIDGQIVTDSKLAFAFIGWNAVPPTILLQLKVYKRNLLTCVTTDFSLTLAPRNMRKFWIG
jgi:hypothetical protein